jgi:EAL domain-containing protein (putative c-di-GMP-specific phosphodiesterase class I)
MFTVYSCVVNQHDLRLVALAAAICGLASFAAMGSGLGLPVIAEGVETAEELAFLNAEGCEEVQGHYLGRPQPIET